jgi:ABC-type nitrate/sulfonate/bicarbonate transport system ATPase subunit
MAWFEARDVRKEYRSGASVNAALDGFSMSADRGGFVSIIGRSGSGKTTFLRIAAGLIAKTSGEITYSDGVPPRVGMVFQEPRLMPWLTVAENLLFPYKAAERRARVDMALAMLDTLGLSGCAGAYPGQLSGGMAQRVSLGRALCWEPEMILMDEPLGSLDYFTRASLREEIIKIYLRERKTILFVTHDVDEAVAMSRGIVLLERGRAVKSFAVDLPYPRRRTDPKFAAIVEDILASMNEAGRGNPAG